MLHSFSELVAALSIFNYGLFYWGVAKHFQKTSELDKTYYNILVVATLITWFANTLYIFAAPQNSIGSLAGVILQMVSTYIFVKTKNLTRKTNLTLIFSKDLPSKLISTGPYRFVRHPFYTSYLLCYFGAALASHSVIPYICFFVMLVIYHKAAVAEENKFGNSDLSSAYKLYKEKTGRFLPNLIKILSSTATE